MDVEGGRPNGKPYSDTIRRDITHTGLVDVNILDRSECNLAVSGVINFFISCGRAFRVSKVTSVERNT